MWKRDETPSEDRDFNFAKRRTLAVRCITFWSSTLVMPQTIPRVFSDIKLAIERQLKKSKRS